MQVLLQPHQALDRNMVIAVYLLNQWGLQKAYGLVAPPKGAVFKTLKPLQTDSSRRESVGLDSSGCIPPGVYKVTDGYVDDGFFWLELESSKNGQKIRFDVGNNQTIRLIDWREVKPIN